MLQLSTANNATGDGTFTASKIIGCLSFEGAQLQSWKYRGAADFGPASVQLLLIHRWTSEEKKSTQTSLPFVAAAFMEKL